MSEDNKPDGSIEDYNHQTDNNFESSDEKGKIESTDLAFERMLSQCKRILSMCNPSMDAFRQFYGGINANNYIFQVSTYAQLVTKQLKQTLSILGSDSLMKMIDNYNSTFEIIKTPMLDWLRSLDFSPIIKFLNSYQIDSGLSQKYREINEIYLKTMYESKWFPYAGWTSDVSLFETINDIINTSKGANKNREKRIDKAILSYYSPKELKSTKSSWWNSNLDYCLRKTLCQAMNAYFRGEYALTISCLSTMWEGLIYIKAKDVPASERKRQNMQDTKDELHQLVEFNNYEEIFSNYFNDFIVSNCNAVYDVIEGVPNRHGIAHGWYLKYPNKKAALNAILLTDFIINLQPIEKTEEENG